VIFDTRLKRKQKKYARERTSSLEWHGGLGGFQTAIYLEGYMDGIHSKNEVCMLHATITVRFRELALACSWLHYHAHKQLHSICFTWKANGKIFFLLHPFFICYFFINIFNWQYFYVASYGSWTRAKPDGIFVETNVRSDDRQKRVQEFMDSRA